MNSKLLDQIDKFYKMAALLQAPESMIRQISEWANSVYCGAMLPIIDQEIAKLSKKSRFFRAKDRLVELSSVKELCEQYYRSEDTNPKYFPIKLDELPYFSKLEQMDMELLFRRALRYPVIKAELILSPEQAKTMHKENWEGMWLGDGLLLHQKLMLPESISKDLLFKVFERLKITTRHELQHMVQDYMQRLKNLKEWGGLPSKRVRDVTVDPHGQSIIPIEPSEMTPHGLRDVEFYTNLTDSIENFKAALPKFPPSVRRALFNAWIGAGSYEDLEKLTLQEHNKSLSQKWFGPKTLRELMPEAMPYIFTARRFFNTLKDAQFEKYKKAVSEFYKAVQPYL